MKGQPFLSNKVATRLWFGMVIGFKKHYNHNSRYAPHVEEYGPQGPIYNIKASFFTNQGSLMALVCDGDRYCSFTHPQQTICPYVEVSGAPEAYF